MLSAIRDFGGLAMIKAINRGLRGLTSFGHRIQMMAEWSIHPNPEWFDHFIDQHCQWHRTRHPYPWERGIFSLLVMRPGARVLELCCGDGFNAYHFYSIRASRVFAVDFNAAAIAHARKNFRTPNVLYDVRDIRTQMPASEFDNIIWDAGISHFTAEETERILEQIHSQMPVHGVLSGYTTAGQDGQKIHSAHQQEYQARDDLQLLLERHFAHVVVWQTQYPSRRNLYFFASDMPLPFQVGTSTPVCET